MRIRKIDVHNLVYDYPPDQGYSCAEGETGSRLTSLVVVQADGDLIGVGSAYSHPDLVRIIVEQHLAPFLVGEDPSQTDLLWDRMYSLTRWYGRQGVAISALGAVDIALWDLRGKLEDRPLYDMLGGTRTTVQAYASGLLWQDDLDALRAEARAYLANGYSLMKMRIGRDPEYDCEAVTAVAQEIGDKGRVAVDGTHRYSLAGATEVANVLAEQGVVWFEEPFPPEDIETYIALCRRKIVPIAAGENEYGLQGFRQLIGESAIDVAQPDISRTGGVTEARRIVALAGERGIPVASHTWSDAIALTASAHLVAAAPTGMAIEVEQTYCPFTNDLLSDPLPIRDGFFHLSDEPGLGVTLDWDVVNQLGVPPDTLIKTGNFGDLVFGRQPYVAVPPVARR